MSVAKRGKLFCINTQSKSSLGLIKVELFCQLFYLFIWLLRQYLRLVVFANQYLSGERDFKYLQS
jgi:hypothetical protein